MTTPQEPTDASTPAQHTDWWGDPISEERQAELDALAEQQRMWAEQPEATRGDSPVKGVRFTGAEVFWLATRALAGPGGDADALAAAETRLRSQDFPPRYAPVPQVKLSALHMEKAFLDSAQLAGAKLDGAHLEGADLSSAHLEGADLRETHLEGASLSFAHMEKAWLASAHLAGAGLGGAHLAGAILSFAHLAGAFLLGAHLEGVHLDSAQLAGANLQGAHLEEADLTQAHLEEADLTQAHLDEGTQLEDAHLGPGAVRDWLDHLRFRNRNTALGDIKWRGADLTAVPWEEVRRLGDERDARWLDGADKHRDVVRAYRQVATQLRAQGMAEDADRFSYRAQIRQRGVLLRTFRLPQYLFSWVLALLAGYGYRPGRTLFWYLVTIAGFAFMYMQATHGWIPFGLPEPSKLAPLPWYEALILSVSSFHGRGFFQPLQSLGDPVAALAAIEAVIGLFIEISFIATFTQRYFGNK